MGSGDFKLIAGLGNPGTKYLKTRHNVGFMAIERIADKNSASFNMNKKIFGNIADFGIGNLKKRLLMPNTFMNESGRSISAAMDWFGIEANQLLILVDDMDLPLGALRFRKEGGSGGHNGLKNIIMHLGSQNFCRLRIGIGAPSLNNEDRKQKTIPHVLGKFEREEEIIITNMLEKIINGIDIIETHGLDKGINYLNTYKTDPII